MTRPRFFAALAICLGVALPLQAHNGTRTILGTVADSPGAVLPEATITFKTGQSQSRGDATGIPSCPSAPAR